MLLEVFRIKASNRRMRRNCDRDYVDNLEYLFECAKKAQSPLGKLVRDVAPIVMCFAPLRCKVMLQEWTAVVPNLVLDEDELTVVDRFSCPNWVTKDGGTVLK